MAGATGLRGCGRAGGGVLVWDLRDNTGDRVQGPASQAGDRWLIDNPQTVRLILPGDERHEVAFEVAIVRRVGKRVTAVRLMRPPGTLDDVDKQARSLAAEWHISELSELDRWRET